jgi:hypothetical protein
MEIRGSIMSSVIHAGGQRAVAAGILDRMAPLPVLLADVAVQASELREVAERRGHAVSHGLSLQLILERLHKNLLHVLADVGDELAEAGPEHLTEAAKVRRWRTALATAAVNSLSADGFRTIVEEVSAMVAEMRLAVQERSNLVVASMQACEAEATGTVTLIGRGVFNSHVVAWGGLHAEKADAVMRGGSLIAHGPVNICELGSPSGAKITVQLGRHGSLAAELVHAGTQLSGPGHSHQFVADRTHVRVRVQDGSMDVHSFAA